MHSRKGGGDGDLQCVSQRTREGRDDPRSVGPCQNEVASTLTSDDVRGAGSAWEAADPMGSVLIGGGAATSSGAEQQR